MRKSELDEHGRELLDPTPLALPTGFKRPETLSEQIQRMVRTHLSQAAAEQGFETFEESEDFDCGEDDIDPRTPFEMDFDPVLGREVSAQMLRDNPDAYREEYVSKAVDHPDTDAQVAAVERKANRRRPARSPGEQNDGPVGPSPAQAVEAPPASPAAKHSPST